MNRLSFVSVCLLCLVAGGVLSGCGWVDERMADCPEESTMTLIIDLVNNKDAELNSKLGSEHDRPVRAALEDYLTDVFAGTAHDVDLSFYDQRRRHERTFHQTLVMDAEEKVVAMRIPASDYLVIGAANVSKVPTVKLISEDEEENISLSQGLSKRVETHPAPLFTARRRMLVNQERDQRFEVNFHMINSAAALVLNCDSCEVKSIRAEYGGLADAFRIADSSFLFSGYSMLKTDVIDVEPYLPSLSAVEYDITEEADWIYDEFWTRWTKTPLMVCGVGFPSPAVASSVEGTTIRIWSIYLYVTLTSGSTTLSELSIGAPLPAGSLKIIKGWLLADGSFSPVPPHEPYNPGPGGPFNPDPPTPDSTEVTGVSVSLNWKEGSDYNPIIGY